MHTGRAPPVTLMTGTEGEARLLLSEPVRLVDQPLPVPTAGQRKAHRRRADAQLPVVVVLLAIPPGDQLLTKAPGKFQVRPGTGGRLLRRSLVVLAPVL